MAFQPLTKAECGRRLRLADVADGEPIIGRHQIGEIVGDDNLRPKAAAALEDPACSVDRSCRSKWPASSNAIATTLSKEESGKLVSKVEPVAPKNRLQPLVQRLP